MKKTDTKKKLSLPMIIVVIASVILLIVAVFIVQQVKKEPSDKVEVITVSTLEKIINVSELSTFTAVYNGIAQVMNEKNPEETDYYVSYEAKEIYISIPEVYITEVNVDISSLDFIFCNEKANTSTVSQQAFKVCEADVKNESEQQSAIYELAKQNAINVLTALTKPIIEQLDAEYTLVIE